MVKNLRDGQYYYAPLRGRWGVWQHHNIGDGFTQGVFVCSCNTKEEAAREVYRRNGWLYKQ